MEKKKPKLNAAWHSANPMPKNPSLEQRMQWHLEHHNNCACREIPEKLLTEMQKRKLV